MKARRTLLFNHIPKTGGVTLRIILNRVYGAENIFLIKSTDIGESLNTFSLLSEDEKNRFAIVAGHGAELFSPYIHEPFRVTILREPVSLFISQYYYLRNSKDSNFFNEVRTLGSIEEYLDYAIEKGQDNLLTRYLSNSIGFIVDPNLPVPVMRQDGPGLLASAGKALDAYDAVIDLGDFDAGVFALARKLGWDHIPVYRPANINRNKPAGPGISGALLERLQEVLRFDLALYASFRAGNMGAGIHLNRHSVDYRIFRLRQSGIRFLARALNKS